MADDPPRARPTLRCLTKDLGMAIPPLDVELSDIDHPLMEQARRIAPDAPKGQKRVLAIDHPLVYQVRHSRWRGATWLEAAQRRLWLLAGAQREEGSDDDAYEHFDALHTAGKLLPTPKDELRDDAEKALRLTRAARGSAPSAIATALGRVGEDVPIVVDGRIEMRLHATAPDELWIAISTRTTDGATVDEPVRDVLFALFLDEAHAVEVEERGDWPTGEPLPWFEVARFALLG
jgi:hypothetical protein